MIDFIAVDIHAQHVLRERETEADSHPLPKRVAPRSFGSGTSPTFAISLASAIALIGVWWLATELHLVSPLFLPSPSDVWEQAVAVVRDGYAGASFFHHVWASLRRILIAAAIAISLGIPAGLFMGINRWAKGILDAPIGFYWPLPPLSYLPLIIIWLGIGETAKITLLALSMFAPVTIAAQAGVRAMPVERIYAGLSLGASRWNLLTDIILPSALPEILTGIRIALGVGWGTLVAAELIAATEGVGFMTLSASHFLATDVVFVGIATIAALAFGFSLVMKLIERVLVPWRGKL